MTVAAEYSPVGMLCTPLEKKIGKTTIKLLQGDLTAMPIDAFVFYARKNLEIGAGFGTAISSRGGISIKKELEQIGSIKMGEAVITKAGEMKPRHIIHACGPKFQEADTEKKLRDCMISSMKVAGDNNLKVIAFPPMGTGFYGIPLDVSARVMLDTMREFLQKGDTSLEELIICVMDHHEYLPFKKKFESL